MAFPVSSYVEDQDGALRIAGTRVSLSSVIVHFQQGQTPEQIVDSFPTLTLAYNKYLKPRFNAFLIQFFST
ncbi:MAG: DUF433 domain-containing protein [Candidatus Solibacter usitatus]|nr:DUF433 domain-containing protein [Candidatus Solibacter usitatus]